MSPLLWLASTKGAVKPTRFGHLSRVQQVEKKGNLVEQAMVNGRGRGKLKKRKKKRKVNKRKKDKRAEGRGGNRD